MYQCSPKFVTKRKESILGVDLSVHPITMSTVLAYSKKRFPRLAPLETLVFPFGFFNGEIHDHENPPNQKNTHPELFLSDFSRMPNPTRGFSMPFFEAVPSKCFAQLLSLRSLVLAENSLEVGQNSLEVRESKSKVIPCDSCTSWCHLVDTFQ